MKYIIYILLFFSASAFSQNYYYTLGEKETGTTPAPPNPQPPPEERNTDNILMKMLFDSPEEMEPVNSDWYNEFANNESFQTEKSISRAGPSSGRFQIRKSDKQIWGGQRAEISQAKRTTGSERWYGFSQYFPGDYGSDGTGDVIGQWHDVPDSGEATNRSPSNALIASDDKLKWMVRWDADRIMTDGYSDGTIYIDLGKIPKDRWIDWVVHIKYSHTNTGILEVWMDGVKVIDRQNMPNAYNDSEYPYLKLGNYKWDWGANSIRVLYWDEVRIGSEKSNYDEVKPGGY